MRPPRLVMSMLACALALTLTGCAEQLNGVLHRNERADPAVRADRQASKQASQETTPPSEPTVGQLWSSFQVALSSATSMRMTGVVHLSGKAATVDLSGTCDGTNGKSSVVMDNQNLEVTTVAGTYYVKANTAYWRSVGMSQGTIIAIGSRYLATKEASLAQFTVAGFVASLKTEQAISDGMGVIAEKTTLTGRPVYLFSVRTKEGRLTIWVTDTAYTLLRMRYETAAGTDDVTFSEWNVPVSYKAPPPAQVIRL